MTRTEAFCFVAHRGMTSMGLTRHLMLLTVLQSAAAFTAQGYGSCPVSRSVTPPLMWIKVVPEEDKDRTVRISTSATAPAKDANSYALMLEQMAVDQGEAEEDGEEAAFDPDFDEDVLAMMYHRDAPASKDDEAARALAIDEAATAQLEAEAALESRAAAEAKVAAAERVAAEAAIELARAKAEAAMEIANAEEAVQRARLAMERAGVSHEETEALTAMAEASVLAEAEGAAQAEAEAEAQMQAQMQAQMEAQMQAQLEAQMQAQMQAETEWEAEQAPEEDHNAGVSIGGDDASFWASASKPAPKPKPSPAPRPRPPPPSTPPKAPPVTSISTGGAVRMKINGKQVTTQGPVRIGANEGRRGDGDTEDSQFWAPATSKKAPDTTPRPPSTATTESSLLTAAFAKAVGAKGVGSAASTAKPTAAVTTPKSKPKPKPSTPPPPSEKSKSIPSQVEHTAWWDSHKPSNTRFGQ